MSKIDRIPKEKRDKEEREFNKVQKMIERKADKELGKWLKDFGEGKKDDIFTLG